MDVFIYVLIYYGQGTKIIEENLYLWRSLFGGKNKVIETIFYLKISLIFYVALTKFRRSFYWGK